MPAARAARRGPAEPARAGRAAGRGARGPAGAGGGQTPSVLAHGADRLQLRRVRRRQQPRAPVFGGFGGRTDLDVIGYWSLQNLGVGNVALIRIANARLQASRYQEIGILNLVRSEVAESYARSYARYAQIGTYEQGVRSGKAAFDEDLIRIRARGERNVLPIELLEQLPPPCPGQAGLRRHDRRLQPVPVRAVRRPGPAAGRHPGAARRRRPGSSARRPASTRRRRPPSPSPMPALAVPAAAPTSARSTPPAPRG